MGGALDFLKAEEPEEVDGGAEKAKLERERKALMARSAYDRNTRTTGAGGVGTPAKVFRSTLGR